ncbi:hypothetical protein ARMGADRAFT_359732 [Armillaria gallica]|uniref:Secreted protein n=1 Tax=Armillaria gallica TaxID=47427 RepID=A0A2H3DM25_ARMGA|nr:hypothetical protein ARMGADRAFT_359732 [Armillaria gallica]
MRLRHLALNIAWIAIAAIDVIHYFKVCCFDGHVIEPTQVVQSAERKSVRRHFLYKFIGRFISSPLPSPFQMHNRSAVCPGSSVERFRSERLSK